MDLDDADKQILNLLQNGDMCGPRINRVARILGMSPSTVHNRIKRLEDSGLISGYSAVIDTEKAGKKLTVFSLVKLKYPKTEEDFEFDEKIGQLIAFGHPAIQEVHTLTGEWELLVKIKARDMDEYYAAAREGIIKAAQGRVEKVNGLIALSTLKEDWKIKF